MANVVYKIINKNKKIGAQTPIGSYIDTTILEEIPQNDEAIKNSKRMG